MVEPFRVSVGEDVLADLRARLRATRWPDPAPGPAWSQGTDLHYLRDLVREWADTFDWRSQERRLNAYDHFTTVIDGARTHFVHRRTGRPALVLAHGWPSCFVEMLPLVDRLSDEFDLVVPSLPGYVFSSRPEGAGVDTRRVAAMWLELMSRLGYERFGVVGGDFGAAVATHLALLAPERVRGILLTTPEVSPVLGPDSPPLSPAERAYLAHVERWDATERGYSAIQSTRPQTLGYGLADSPAGLAAWLVEKWRAWSDSGGDLDTHPGRDVMLTVLTLYWATNSITSSVRDYYDNRWHGTALTSADRVQVPTAVSVFAHEHVPEGEPPREWFERLYDVRQWSVSPRGGHFAAIEAPEVLAEDVRRHFSRDGAASSGE
ncbi:epoxide hydrolase family protein [Antribacter gilvus]|uniref:epoxide hydrolase family protein n=1 Tax=Antribacter gilvus TaxID=2304675 RepID=UPI000F795957|nr:epoxide hydrolase family protein [Antribacter gilvus]